ncbi:hypothetical protein [uncultured Phenylobacterium sp.]|nr:hypothetical protein [uncultured Phenylobacterium sp.]
MSRNGLFFLVGALVVVAAVLGYMVYEDRKQPDGLEINVGSGGITVEEN